MSIEQIGIVAAAAVVAAWPHLAKAVNLVWPKAAASHAAPVTYEVAIKNLAVVRSRLIATSLLAENEKKAIDTLTLALVAGSDK